MTALPVPKEPVRIALIGGGARASSVYLPLWESLRPWCVPVAVCDPVEENGRRLADRLGLPAYTSIRRLVRDRPMEAAVVVTPVQSHHSISMFLSTHGIHNHTETTWASMLCQAREMIATARNHRVIVRVAENFLRMPIDRFAQTVRDSGYLGRIGRVFSYADHTGYHNNSRWIALAKSHPRWVQCVEHEMAHPAFYSTPQRRHDKESLNARFYHFPGDLLVMDVGSGHVKGHLGRHPRPGYTEWHGERGALVHRAGGAYWGSQMGTELRYVSEARFAAAQEAAGDLTGGGVADQVTPVIHEDVDQTWRRSYADTPSGRIEYVNPLPPGRFSQIDGTSWYGVAVMAHVVDFVLAVRGLRDSEFTDEDALMSEMMEIGARQSALDQGRRIMLPIEGEIEADQAERQRQRRQLGVDPMDVEAMLSVSFPRP